MVNTPCMRAGHPAPYGRVEKPTFRPWHMALYENLVNQWSVQFFPIKIAISWKNSYGYGSKLGTPIIGWLILN